MAMWDEPNSSAKGCGSLVVPLTAFIIMEVKNNYALVTMKGILNKISELKISVGYMVTFDSDDDSCNVNYQ
jgi:hypothetical protein